MAVTATTFIQRFPEFSNLESAVITATIAESQRQNDSDLWGDQYDDAVNYMTAHRSPAVHNQSANRSASVRTLVSRSMSELRVTPLQTRPTALLISICGRG